jgi:hypothetical protein
MNIVTINVTNKLDPVEVQSWLDSHAEVTVIAVDVYDDRFYIVYK